MVTSIYADVLPLSCVRGIFSFRQAASGPSLGKSYCRDTWKGIWNLARWNNPNKVTFVP